MQTVPPAQLVENQKLSHPNDILFDLDETLHH